MYNCISWGGFTADWNLKVLIAELMRDDFCGVIVYLRGTMGDDSNNFFFFLVTKLDFTYYICLWKWIKLNFIFYCLVGEKWIIRNNLYKQSSILTYKNIWKCNIYIVCIGVIQQIYWHHNSSLIRCMSRSEHFLTSTLS